MSEERYVCICNELQKLRSAIYYLANCIDGFGEHDAKRLLEIFNEDDA